jgi:hypothetical protein
MKLAPTVATGLLLAGAGAAAQRGPMLQLERQHGAQVVAAAQPGRPEQMAMMQQLAGQHAQQDTRHVQQQLKSDPVAAPVVGSNRARRQPPQVHRKRQQPTPQSPQALLGPVTPAKGAKMDKIPMVGLGTFGFFTRRAATDAIVSAFQKGIRHIDAAMIYQNEPHVGAGIAEGLKRNGLKREDVWVTTKLWNNRSVLRRGDGGEADGLKAREFDAAGPSGVAEEDEPDLRRSISHALPRRSNKRPCEVRPRRGTPHSALTIKLTPRRRGKKWKS